MPSFSRDTRAEMRSFVLVFLALDALFAQDPPLNVSDGIKSLTVMVDADTQAGSGLIFASRNDRVYIVTANHVVRPNNLEARDIKVFFRWLPGEPFKATMLNPHDASALDLAVIAVPLTVTSVDKQRLPFEQLGEPAAVPDGTVLWAVGHPGGTAWELSDPLRVRQPDGIRFSLRGAGLPDGYSGGPVFDGNGLIVGIGREALEVTRIDRVVEQLKSTQWNFDVDLKQPPWGVHFRDTLLRYVSEAPAGFTGLGEKAVKRSAEEPSAAAFVPTIKFTNENICFGGVIEHNLGITCFLAFGLDRSAGEQQLRTLTRNVQFALPTWKKTDGTDVGYFLSPESTVRVEVRLGEWGRNGASASYTLAFTVLSLRDINSYSDQ